MATHAVPFRCTKSTMTFVNRKTGEAITVTTTGNEPVFRPLVFVPGESSVPPPVEDWPRIFAEAAEADDVRCSRPTIVHVGPHDPRAVGRPLTWVGPRREP